MQKISPKAGRPIGTTILKLRGKAQAASVLNPNQNLVAVLISNPAAKTAETRSNVPTHSGANNKNSIAGHQPTENSALYQIQEQNHFNPVTRPANHQ